MLILHTWSGTKKFALGCSWVQSFYFLIQGHWFKSVPNHLAVLCSCLSPIFQRMPEKIRPQLRDDSATRSVLAFTCNVAFPLFKDFPLTTLSPFFWILINIEHLKKYHIRNRLGTHYLILSLIKTILEIINSKKKTCFGKHYIW